MNEAKKVSILGCGWVGKALKESLVSKGYAVYCLSYDMAHNNAKGFYDVDVLVVALPPSVNEYLDVLKSTIEYLTNKDTQVVFLSSTSFYDGRTKVVEAEKFVQKLSGKPVILRLGGLMGYDRIAGKYTAGKTLQHDSYSNYIHRDDVIGVIKVVIDKEIKNTIYDVVAPKQSRKKEIFSQNAKQFGFEHTIFASDVCKGKRVYPKKLVNSLGYAFQKEDVIKFWDNN